MSANALHSSSSNDWYTPPEIVALARHMLGGGIDLDPASNLVANRIVDADRFYNSQDNGLECCWGGKHENVFNNPPYGGMTTKFVDKALSEKSSVIMLVNATPGRKWFGRLVDSSQVDWFYFFRDRIQFIDPVTMKRQKDPTHENCFVGIRTGPPPCLDNIELKKSQKGWYVPRDKIIIP